MRRVKFDSWLAELECEVIQGEFGYEPGEFTVYPSEWYPLYQRGLSPHEAWQRAFDMRACGRIEEECLKAINWARICFEDGRATTTF